MTELTIENFDEEVLNSEVPVLIDFWAPWCGPCKLMMPVIEELSEEYEGQIKFCKLNTEEQFCSDLPLDFGITSIPTLVIVVDKDIVVKEVGLKTKDVVQSIIEEALV